MSRRSVTQFKALDETRREVERLSRASEPLAWYAAVVTPTTEYEVIRRLVERGYEAFTTTEVRWRWKSRTDRLDPGTKKTPTSYALIPGIVFVGIGNYTALAEVWAMPFIKGFLGSGPLSSRLSDADMIRLRDMSEEADAPDEARAMISREEYTIGELCEVVAGPLTGQHFTVNDITGDGSKQNPFVAVVDAMFFGEINLPLDTLIPV